MRRFVALIAAVAFVTAGCGSEDDPKSEESQPVARDTAPAQTETAPAEKPEADGTAITVRDSEFGPMLFDSRKQAIYIFENDSEGRTVCYDECAEAWPPVYTKGEPKATGAVKQSLLGTVERRDGRRQVTYAGKPLYFYAHEEPGEVRCHNVNLNGGLWWVVGPDGRRRP